MQRRIQKLQQDSLKRNYIYNVLYQMLLIIVPLITSPYLTRVIGANGLGIYSFTQSYAHYFVLFIMLGLNNYGNREISKVRDDSEKTSKTFVEIYLLQFIMMLVIATIYCLLLLFTVKENKYIYWLQLLYVISAGFDINWCCFGLEKFKLTVIRNGIIKIISAILVLVFVNSANDLWIYTLIIAGSTFFSQIVIWPFIIKEIKFIKPTFKGVVSRIRPNLLLFLPVIAVSLYTIMDKLMLGIMCDKTEVGYYTYAERIIQIPLSFVTALGTVMLPRASNMIYKGKEEESKRLLFHSMQFIMLFSFGCMFGMMAIADELIPWYYGPTFLRCSIFTVWLSPVIALTSWNNVIRTQVVIPKGLDKIYLYTVTTGAVVNIIVNSMLIPKYQGTGAVVGTLMAEGSVCLVQYVLVRKYIELKKILFDILVFCVSGLIMAIVLSNIPFVLNIQILNIIIKCTIGMFIYCVLTLGYLIIIKKDYYLINSLMGKILKRS